MTDPEDFRRRLGEELDDLLLRSRALMPEGERLRIDLHCHDFHSDRPDERLGRILGVPETWVTTEDLLATLRSNRTDVVTVTNHNDARTCWELLDKGQDVLVGAEFSCTLPDFGVGVHVLTYGFTPAQEARLKQLRRDIYRFADFCAAQDIPTVLAHPLQFHSQGLPPMEVMDRLGLLFERFETVNGQRDTWQNVLSAAWVEAMDEEEIRAMARRARQPVDLFVRDPWRKRATGGSDDHMAMFAGSTGTWLSVPDFAARRAAGARLSELALEAIRAGHVAPYGGYNEEEKLAAALLDYFCQVVLNMEDPGLLRLALHKGEARDKALALLVANAVFELRRHRVTMGFLRTVHEAFGGKSPGLATRLATNRDFRPLLDSVTGIAHARRKGSAELAREVDRALPAIFRHLGTLLASRVQDKAGDIGRVVEGLGGDEASLEEPVGQQDSERPLIERLELPAHLRRLASGEPRRRRGVRGLGAPGLAELADGLPYPLLAAVVIGGASYAACRVLHDKRPFLDAFAEKLGQHRHPHRALWLTDTWDDRNGVSHALAATLDEIRRRDLPVDLCVVSDTLEDAPHLRVLRPVGTFQVPAYPQPLRIPDLMEVQKLFHHGGYDRVVCSTEGPMGLLALHLKQAFSVPAWFFVHTDWLDFARTSLGWNRHSLARLRRILRAFYRGFDGLFVLNSEMREWLSGSQMGIAAERLHATAHWPEAAFTPRAAQRATEFEGCAPDDPVLVFAGRLSDEKGVRDLPAILAKVRERHPRTRLVLAGSGPSEAWLRANLPDATFLGWSDRDRLARAFSAADLLVLPSRFDTFGCVVLEAMACGLPVAAYPVKGPKDLVEPGISGVLAESGAGLAVRIADVLADPQRLEALREGARARAGQFRAEPIVNRLLADIGLGDLPVRLVPRDLGSEGGDLLAGFLELVQGDAQA